MATKKLRANARVLRVSIAGVAALALAGGLSACSGGSEGDASGELQILVSSADASDAAFKAVTAAFEKAHPEVKVTLSSVSNDNYPATKSSRLTAGNVDIVVVRSLAEVPEFAADSTAEDVLLARAGGLLDLTGKDFMKNYTPSVLDAQAVDGKQFAIPTGLSYSTGVYYNKAIFQEQGLQVPTTWTEMQQVMAKLSGAGVTPFGVGGKDVWPAGLAMLGSVAGEYPTAAEKQALVEGLWKNTVKLTDAKPLAVLQKTEAVLQNAQPNAAGTGYDEIPAGFAAGKYAMTVDGTWNEPTIRSAVGSAFEYGYFPFPGSDNAADNASLNGKIELQLAVAANSKHQDAALAWMEFFSDPKNYAGFVETSGFSSAQPDIAASEFLTSIADYTKTFEPAWDTLWIANNRAGQDAVYPFNYAALTPLGSKTAQQAADDAATAWTAAF